MTKRKHREKVYILPPSNLDSAWVTVDGPLIMNLLKQYGHKWGDHPFTAIAIDAYLIGRKRRR